MEKHSSIERIIGKIPNLEKEDILREKSKILSEMNEQFDDQKFEKLLGKEREKAPEETKIINLINEVTNEIRRKYGLDDFDIPADNIHLVKEKNWEYKGTAFYKPNCQAVIMVEQPSKIVLAKKVLHEMLHFKSYNAVQITAGDKPKLEDYRTGFSMVTRDGRSTYFTNLNEAVTEEMTKRTIKEMRAEMSDNALFKGEIKQTEETMERYPDAVMDNGRPLFDQEIFFAEIEERRLNEKNGEFTVSINAEKFSYLREREILNALIDKILSKNHDKFGDREEIFDVFARGMMTGNILPLARLIDGTFGLGTLRKIGELDGNIQAQAEFVASL